MDNFALELKGVTKQFGEKVIANDNVDLQVRRGEILAILGENGSGKTTLMNMVSGIYFPDKGQIFVNGEEVVIKSPKDAFKYKIGMIHQHFKLVDVFTATENIILGIEDKKKYNIKEAKKEVQAIIDKYGFTMDLDKKIYNMSVSEKQTVEIIKVLYRGADILILDEPTASLNTDEVEHMFQIVRGLRDKGTSFIFISHKMPEIFALCDTYTVLRNGKFIANGNIADTTPREVTNLLVGAALSDRDAYEPRELGEEMLRVEHFSGEGFADVTFTARRGQIIGLTGLKGCGSSELMQGLFGIHHPSGGNVEVCGKKLHGGSIHEAMGAGIAMLPADRKENSVIPDMSLLENMYLSEHVLSARSFAINTKRENERFEKYGKLLKAIGEKLATLDGNAVVAGGDCPEMKPSGLPLRQAASQLNGHRLSAHDWMVGDNWTDLDSGANAGIKTAFCTFGFGHLKESRYTVKINRLDELLRYLKAEET